MVHFVPADRRQPMLLPRNLKDWGPKDDLTHFVIEAVEAQLWQTGKPMECSFSECPFCPCCAVAVPQI